MTNPSPQNSSLVTNLNKLYLTEDMTGVVDKLAVRQFEINFQNTTALLLRETDQDFLVALPATINRDAGRYEVSLNASVFARRLFKTSISSVSLPAPQETYIYLKTLGEVVETFPEFFVEERLKTLNGLVSILEEELGRPPLETPRSRGKSAPSSDFRESMTEGPPLPEFAGRPNLKEYIEEEIHAGVSAINNGKIMPPPGALPKIRH